MMRVSTIIKITIIVVYVFYDIHMHIIQKTTLQY